MESEVNEVNLANVLYRPDVNSIPEALKIYIKELRETKISANNFHANALEYYLRTVQHRNFLTVLRRTFNEIYTAIEKAYPEIRFKIEGRRKSLLSTEKKILSRLDSVEKIQDYLGVRIIIFSDGIQDDPKSLVSACYDAMFLIIDHLNSKGYILCEVEKIPTNEYKGDLGIYIPERSRLSSDLKKYVKDYIFYPKKVGYQTLHAVFRFPSSGDTFELQVRSFNMHLHGEYGAANHDSYKEKKYGENILNLDKNKIHIPGYAVLPDGKVEDFIGLEKSLTVLTRSKTF